MLKSVSVAYYSILEASDTQGKLLINWRRLAMNHRYKAILGVLCTLGTISLVTLSGCSKGNKDAIHTEAFTYTSDEYISEMISHNYTSISKTFTAPDYLGEEIEFPIAAAYQGSEMGKLTLDNYNYGKKVFDMKIGDTATFQVDVPETAVYRLRFDYLSYDKSILPIVLSMKLNGEYPYYESRRLVFETTWVSDVEKSYDRYGKEIVSIPNKLIRWETKYLMDASYRHSEPLKLELAKGKNEITLGVSEGSLLLGNIYLEPICEIPQYIKSEPASGKERIILQGEDFTYRNDSSIRAVAEFDADVEPYNVKETILNTIDSDSFKDAGQTVTYEFNVKKEGYYYLGLKYRQSDKEDFPVFVDVRVDNEVPNTAFKAYPLSYGNGYQTETLKDKENINLSVYLTQGTHSISYTINIDHIRHVLESVDCIMSEINDLSLEVTKVAGTNKDKYRDLKLTRYIPDVEERIYGWADSLDALHDSCLRYNEDVNKIAAFSSIKVASKQLRSLAKEPDELIYRVAELSSSINSINTQLANLIDLLGKNRLAIDRIYLYQEEAKLPGSYGFFTKAAKSIKRFGYSFFQQSYSVSNINPEHLQVWVNRPRQHVEIMQKMIDEQFTPQTGIKVDLSIMPDQNKLVLANASGDAPDIATGINYAIPFELGIRGAIKDLTEFTDFKEIAGRFSPGILLPATIGDGIYALPETMNFWVLFYRTDMFDKLGLTVPNTMEEVMDMLPELQIRGLNFYYPTAGMLVMRNYNGTTPLLFQNGASMYTEYAGKNALNSEEAMKGFTTLTELFTLYNCPIDIPNFYQHFRNGDLPIGIADYNVYNLLVNAAPEIANAWSIALVPGVEDENGEILRYTAGGADSTVMFHSTAEREEMSWRFMKWWSSEEVQTKFGQTLQISYGDEYIWTSANLDAFSNLPWNTKDKEIIKQQALWIMEPPRVLGSYMMEREISNAFNDVVVNGKNLRSRIDDAVKVIDRETERKLEEFGYLKDGIILKEYQVPTMKKVYEIIGNTASH